MSDIVQRLTQPNPNLITRGRPDRSNEHAWHVNALACMWAYTLVRASAHPIDIQQGIGNVLSTPISSVLISGSMRDYVRFGLQHGSRWANLIVYVGTVFAGATVVGLFGWLREKRSTVAH